MRTEVARDAIKALRRVQPARAQDIREAIAKYAADPLVPNQNARPLKGVPNGVRLRVGDWRVSLTVDVAAQCVRVFEIAPRGGAYR